MNRTPPQAQLVASHPFPGHPPSATALDIIGTLARTYEAQRVRLVARGATAGTPETLGSPLRGLDAVEPAVTLDGCAVSASIVDAVVQAPALAGGSVAPPLAIGSVEHMAAQAGWWDALLGDVERRSGLAPRSISIELPPHLPAAVAAVFADRVSS